MIRLSKCLVKGLSGNALLAYVALRQVMFAKDVVEDYFSANQLCYRLGISTDKYKTEIQEGLKKLSDLGYIVIRQTIDKAEYVLDVSKLVFTSRNEENDNGEYFVDIKEEEVKTILSGCKKCSYGYDLLKFLITHISVMNHSNEMGENKGKVHRMSNDFLAKEMNTSVKSVERYNVALEELGLIYIHRSTLFNKSKQTQPHNCYSRLCDMNFCIQYAEQYYFEYKNSGTVVPFKTPDIEESIARAWGLSSTTVDNTINYDEDVDYDLPFREKPKDYGINCLQPAV